VREGRREEGCNAKAQRRREEEEKGEVTPPARGKGAERKRRKGR
jgi:hypothetical protein